VIVTALHPAIMFFLPRFAQGAFINFILPSLRGNKLFRVIVTMPHYARQYLSLTLSCVNVSKINYICKFVYKFIHLHACSLLFSIIKCELLILFYFFLNKQEFYDGNCIMRYIVQHRSVFIELHYVQISKSNARRCYRFHSLTQLFLFSLFAL